MDGCLMPPAPAFSPFPLPSPMPISHLCALCTSFLKIFLSSLVYMINHVWQLHSFWICRLHGPLRSTLAFFWVSVSNARESNSGSACNKSWFFFQSAMPRREGSGNKNTAEALPQWQDILEIMRVNTNNIITNKHLLCVKTCA